MPKIVELEQTGKEWHAWRLAHIGSSDVCKILLCDPFGGPTQDFQLYLEKSGQKKAASSYTSDAQQHGKDSEPIARLQYAGETGNVILPATVECTREGWEFLACSLDGADHELKTICEIKCPGEAGTFREAKEGHIPDNYYSQMQHQLFVTEAERCDYYCWFRGEAVLIPVVPDAGYLETMLPAVKEFWRRVQAKEWPIPKGEITLDSPGYLAWAKQMADFIEMEREIGNQIQAHKAAGAKRFFDNAAKICGGGLEIERTYKKGYTTAPQSRTVAASIATTIRRIE